MTGQQIVEDAFMMAGIQQQGEPLSANDALYAFRLFNQMVSSFSTEINQQWATTTEDFNLTSGVGSYTIGPTGDFVAVRPIEIQVVQIFLTGAVPVGINLEYLSPGDYRRLTLKSITGVPNYYSLNPTIPNSELFIYPQPVQSYPIQITYFAPLATSNLNANYNLPPGYELSFITQLAYLLCTPFGQSPSPELVKQAFAAKRKLDYMNRAKLAMNPQIDQSVPGIREGTIPNAWWGILPVSGP